jgi:DUF1680 family protein
MSRVVKRTRRAIAVALLLAGAAGTSHAAELFPLREVRLGFGPFFDAQATDLNYLMALEPDRLLAPFLREAGLNPRQPSYGNWESSGLDGHMGGHYLSALALMYASTGDPEVKRRLDYFVAELKRAQQANGDGYVGGIPGGRAAWRDIEAGKLYADNFSVNGKWVPWYNLHKLFAGLRDAWRYGGNEDARVMLIALSDWALRLSSHLDDAQMQAMLKSEHGGMNEVLADVYQMTGKQQYLDLALRFSDNRILQPLEHGRDELTGLHANTQIPKVIGFQRIADLSGDAATRKDMAHAAEFFWQTVVEHRTVAIGGNSVKEHFHDAQDFSPMIDEVEGPETCNTYNMLKLTEMLFLSKAQGRYADYYERALYNHILASQRPDSGGFVYFTPMRPNQYRVYSQVDQAMWCCVGSGIESHAKYGEFIYAHEGKGEAAALFVNLFIPSTLNWQEQGVRITQANHFPDQASTHITVDEVGASARFAIKIRYPGWVAPGKLGVKVNGRAVKVDAQPGGYVSLARAWRKGDRVDIKLPMRMQLEQMPDKSRYYAVLYGPIVLAAKTNPFPRPRALGPGLPAGSSADFRCKQHGFRQALPTRQRQAADLYRAGRPGAGRDRHGNVRHVGRVHPLFPPARLALRGVLAAVHAGRLRAPAPADRRGRSRAPGAGCAHGRPGRAGRAAAGGGPRLQGRRSGGGRRQGPALAPLQQLVQLSAQGSPA